MVKRAAPRHTAPTATRPERPDGILVLWKVRAVIDALATLGQAGPSEIAAHIGANKSTTFRLVSSMERIGLLDRTSSGAYALGLWLMELGSTVESRLDIRRIADPELVLLQREVALTCFLIVRHGDQATCIDRVGGSNVDVLALRLGGILPLYAGAGPRVLLATLEPGQLDAYVRRAPFQPLTPGTLIWEADLRADVERTRRQGWALSLEDVTIGVAALGVPVVDAGGNVVAAVSVAGLRHEFEGDRLDALLRRVQESARRISSALGAASDGRPAGWRTGND